jgi:tryptophan synthase beta chain
VISEELRGQLQEQTGAPCPDCIIACVGGGSNAAGIFYHYLDEEEVKLIAVEASGKGVASGESAATMVLGHPGIIHGSRTMLMQNDDGQITEPYSVSAGLDYPGIGPLHAFLHQTGRVVFEHITDDEALEAAFRLTRLEGIVPALESAHALALLSKRRFGEKEVVVVNLSGRGDKDMSAYMNYMYEHQLL